MSRVARILTVLALAVAVVVAFAPASQAGQKAEVRWFQWKTTEVGEKLMNELKAAFEKEHPDITLTLVDNPFQGFHDKALTLFQAQKLADVLMVQVDWVAEYADLGMLEATRRLDRQRAQGVHGEHPGGLPAEVEGEAVLPAAPLGLRGALLEHRDLQERRDRRSAQDLGRVRADRQEGDQPREEDLRDHGHAADRASDQHDL